VSARLRTCSDLVQRRFPFSSDDGRITIVILVSAIVGPLVLLVAARARWFVGRPTRRESGHDGGWRLRVAAVANCEAADRFVNSASPHAAAPRSLTDLHQKPCKPGHVHRRCGVAAVCAIVGARRPSCQERAVLQRGRPPTRGGDERWAAHRRSA